MKNFLLSSILLTLVISSANAATVVEDTLISDTNYKVAGTFGRHDFPLLGDNGSSDWAFTTAKGDVFQLKGAAVTKTNPFGWLKVNVPVPAPAWYMFQLNGDVDGDGSTKFDWVLLSTNIQNKAAYKLAGVTSSGSFAYSAALNIDYIVNGTTIKTGAKGAFELDKQQTYSFVFVPTKTSCRSSLIGGAFTITDDNQVVGKASLDRNVTGVHNGGKVSGFVSESPTNNKKVYSFVARLLPRGDIDGSWKSSNGCEGRIAN